MKLKELLSQLTQVQKSIKASPAYLCGGVPRDRYLKHLENIDDIDLTTGDSTVEYLSQEFAAELQKKYNVTRKVMSDGHSSIFIGKLKIDFSSNYNVPNIEYYLKNKKINNPSDMEKELFSRDFTCNALLLSLDLKNIIDPTKEGFKDINNKVIKTCLAPEITLTNNRNRVIRAIYLACKLNFTIDNSIIKYVQLHPESVKISTNKVMSEKLNQAFEKDADKAVYYLTKMNIWNYIPITEIVYPYYMKHVKEEENVKKRS